LNTTYINLEKQQILSMLQSGRCSEAKTLCTELCSQDKADPEKWFLLAAINAQLGLYDEIIDACRKVITLAPHHEGARYNLGLALQLTGRYEEAAAEYRELLARQPTHTSACINLGQVMRLTGKPEAAIDWFKKALANDPDRSDIKYNLGLAYIDRDDPTTAASLFLQILATDPDNSAALNKLALARYLQSRHSEAAQYVEKALKITPSYADAHHTFASILLASGHPSEAVEHFRKAISLEPENARFHYNLGKSYQTLHKHSEAAQEYRDALSVQPEYTEAWNNLGQCLLMQGDQDQAINCFRNALHIQPEFPALHHNLSTALWQAGMRRDALVHALKAVRNNPENRLFRQNFCQIVNVTDVPDNITGIEEELESSLAVRGIDHQLLATATISVLLQKRSFTDLLQLSERNQQETIADKVIKGEATEIVSNSLFRGILYKTVLPDVRIENLLKSLRRIFLGFYSTEIDKPAQALTQQILDFMCALACQCFNNEYIYLTDSTEQESAYKLVISAGSRLGRCKIPDSRLLPGLVVASMYTPLFRIEHHQSLLEADLSVLPESFQKLVKRQLIEPNIDLSLCKQIESVTPIDNVTSNVVRDQYEGLPYPRWLDVNLHEPKPPADVFGSMFTHFTPPDSASGAPRILIAGCGSGRHAIITATRFVNSEVLAIDLSRSSLAYATRMAGELGVENIRFAQGDILKLGLLDERFDIIESVGVLHHMEDPVIGLNILLNLLRPAGLINIGLYSKLARRFITAAQKYFREKGYSASPADLRKARMEILELELSNPMRGITSTQDFYSLSEFCDLAFHAQECCYSLPEVTHILEQSSLDFIGFELSDPAIKQHYRKLYPDDKNLTNLKNWSEFEQRFPDTFLEMYTFWAQKSLHS
jgi:tetratricopeptide (TPR) repeat protein/SAM-dependent methyltransferase